MRFLGLLLATLVSAVLYGLSFPPAALRPLAWVALVPLLLALRRASTGVAVCLAWLWTVLAAYAVGDWFPRAVSTYYQQPIAVGVGLFLGVSTFMAAAEYMAFAICYRRLVATSRAAPGLPARHRRSRSRSCRAISIWARSGAPSSTVRTWTSTCASPIRRSARASPRSSSGRRAP